MDTKTRDALRKTLFSERERLTADLAELERSGQEALSDMSGENNYRDHMADQGTATFNKELDMSLEENVRDLLEQVDEALARIDAGGRQVHLLQGNRGQPVAAGCGPTSCGIVRVRFCC